MPNALAPEVQNKLLAQDYYRQMADFLASIGATPEVRMVPNLRDARGQLLSGSWGGGEIRMNPNAKYPARTFAHETAHAVDDAILDLAYPGFGRTITPEIKQLQDALKKMNRYEQAKKLNEGSPTTDKYRYSPEELSAFGVGNMLFPDRDPYKVPGHVDATMATWHAVLLELARRAAASKRK